MKKLFASRKSKVIAGAVALVALVAVALTGTTLFYSSHALPGTTLAGQSVSGMTAEQVEALVNESVADSKVSIEGAGEPVEVTLAEAGFAVNTDKTVEAVFADSQGAFSRLIGIFQKREVDPIVDFNDAAFEAIYASLEPAEKTAATNGQVTFDEGAQAFVATASVAGAEVDKETLKNDLQERASSLSVSPVSLSITEVEPDYTTESAQAAAQQANDWLMKDVNAATYDEEVVAAPELAQKATWFKFVPENGALTAQIDKDTVTKWVEETALSTNVEPVEGVQNVNAAGTVLSTAVEGSDGLEVTNASAVADGIISSLQAGEGFYGQFEYAVLERPWTQRVIAEGAENLAYPAAPGEKWIDIDLSNHVVTAYEGATPVMSIPHVSGGPDYKTVTGEYNVWAKVPLQTMRGNNVDGTKYETPDVPWILYFHGGYALHGAYWRTNFGYDAGTGGSHGCVNLPVSSAKQLYDWANVGTKVISRY